MIGIAWSTPVLLQIKKEEIRRHNCIASVFNIEMNLFINYLRYTYNKKEDLVYVRPECLLNSHS